MSDFIEILGDYITPILLVLCLACVVAVGFFSYKKITAAQKTDALIKRNAKQIVLLAFLILSAVIMFFTPFFTFCEIEAFGEYAFSGTDVLFAEEEVLDILLYDEDVAFLVILFMLFVAWYLTSAFVDAVLRVTKYFTEQDEAKYKTHYKLAWGDGIVSALVYWIVALCTTGVLNDELGDYFSVGASFVPLILQILLLAGYTVCEKLIPEAFSFVSFSTSSTKGVPSEQEKIATLKGYKELLDCGALTQEEFEQKKEALLHGNAAETVPQASSEVRSEEKTVASAPIELQGTYVDNCGNSFIFFGEEFTCVLGDSAFEGSYQIQKNEGGEIIVLKYERVSECGLARKMSGSSYLGGRKGIPLVRANDHIIVSGTKYFVCDAPGGGEDQ